MRGERLVVQPDHKRAGDCCRLLCSRPRFLIYKHLPGTISLLSLLSAYIPRNFK